MADEYDLGRHEAQIETLVRDVGEVKADIGWIKQHLAEKKGERRVALWAASVGGAGLATAFGIVLKKLGFAP